MIEGQYLKGRVWIVLQGMTDRWTDLVVRVPEGSARDSAELDRAIRVEVMDQIGFKIRMAVDPVKLHISPWDLQVMNCEAQVLLHRNNLGRINIRVSEGSSEKAIEDYLRSQVISRLIIRKGDLETIDPWDSSIAKMTFSNLNAIPMELDPAMLEELRHPLLVSRDTSTYPRVGGVDVAQRKGAPAREVFEGAAELDL
jgi:hypothetical protein